MHMRRLVTIGVLALLGCSAATSGDARGAIAPDGVTYIPASASANNLARDALEAVFSGKENELAKLTTAGVKANGKVLIGVFMTMAFLNSDLFMPGSLTEGDTKLPLGDKDNTILQAKLLAVTGREQTGTFTSLFYDLYKPSQRITLRKLTKEEMALVWFYIGWDLSEPVYVVHSGDKKLVFEFDPSGKSLMWIEDITAPCFRLKVGTDELPCMCQGIIHKGNHYEPVFHPKKECPAATDYATGAKSH